MSDSTSDAAEKHPFLTPHLGDWPEDFEHENGCYENVCIVCGQTFNGHKRRGVCKLCATAASSPPPPGDEGDARIGQIRRVANDNPQTPFPCSTVKYLLAALDAAKHQLKLRDQSLDLIAKYVGQSSVDSKPLTEFVRECVNAAKAKAEEMRKALELAKATMKFNKVWLEGSEGQQIIDAALAQAREETK